MKFDLSQRIIAASGMAFIVLMQNISDEVVKTIILAAIGGVSSYIFTLGVKFVIFYISKKF